MRDSSLPAIVMCSMWRNDADRLLFDRAEHLLSKRRDYGNLRYLWIVGDSSDVTEVALRYAAQSASCDDVVRVIPFSSGIKGDDVESRMERLSATANVWMENVPDDADYCLIHESDLQSPFELCSVFALHALCGREVIAGWPTLELRSGKVFYDTWAYRRARLAFSNHPPYHPAYKPDEVFEVDSVGSCWMFPARAVNHPFHPVKCHRRAVLDMCVALRQQGYSIWVDPTIEIVQPPGLWQPALPVPDLPV